MAGHPKWVLPGLREDWAHANGAVDFAPGVSAVGGMDDTAGAQATLGGKALGSGGKNEHPRHITVAGAAIDYASGGTWGIGLSVDVEVVSTPSYELEEECARAGCSVRGPVSAKTE